ncbi:MBL fold metallo-hydrolase [Pendulispora rubella]|uniref:MBL fold metallo-hydrolase n=1 Tax=Pendulispora rubella TaxID=2741070 RepID=A0ABZ2LDS2_9BACT
MFELLQHISSLASFAAHRAQRERADGVVLRELTAVPLPLPAGLELEWLGTAGYRLSCEQHTLFIDPYLSRVPLRAVLRGERALPDRPLLERLLGGISGKVAGVLVGHCHFDHALDVPAIARHFGASAYGSASLVRLMELHGLGESAVRVEPHRRYELGPFTVTFVPSEHSKLVLGHRVPFDGELTCEHLDALSPAAYKCGQVWGIRIEVGGTSFYHQGSANLLDDEIPRRPVDIFLAGIAGRRFTRDYWSRILGRLEPKVVVPSHFDDFFRPLGAPFGFSTNVNLAAFPDEIRKVSADFTLASLPVSSMSATPSS